MKKRNCFMPRSRQNGAVLIVGVLLLMVLSILVLSAMTQSVLEERMAGNLHNRARAFQAAEAALRDAETHLTTLNLAPFDPFNPSAFPAACANGLCQSAPSNPLWDNLSATDWNNNAVTRAYGSVTGAAALAGVNAQPRYVIEYQGTDQPISPGQPCNVQLLITARGTGSTASAVVVLQTVYRLRAGVCQGVV
jgi:type IV pilus assembly protein PilX